MKKFNIVYKTTNLVTGTYYIGVHSTDELEDGYLGSGLQLKRSLKKYGKENFKREVIEFCNSPEAAYLLEAKIVNTDLLKDKMCMNLTCGGIGGGGGTRSEETKAKMSASKKGKIPWWIKGKKHTEETKAKMSASSKGQKAWNKGIPHTEETRAKQSASSKGQIPWNKGLVGGKKPSHQIEKD